MRQHPTIPPLQQHGLTLIELLIAMTIGLFIAGAVSALYINTRSGFNYLEEVSRIQETGRFAMDTISRDIRMAGYNGCGKDTTLVNVVTGASTGPFLNFSIPIRGYGDGVAFPSAITNAGAISGTDAIVLLGTDTSSELVVQNHNPSSAQIDTNTHSVKPGEILLITDCAKASIFQVTGPTNNNNNATNVVHNTGTGTPGNCTKFLGASCGSTPVSYTYKPGSSLMRVYSNAYFIANSSLNNGTRSLWSLALEGNTGGSASARELLVGVSDMQINYGLDMNGDGSADQYVTANIVESGGNWGKVIAVRVSLLVASTRTNVATGKQSYAFQTSSGSTTESTVTPGDGVLRQAFSETVVARNRVK